MELVEPSEKYRQSYLEALKEFHSEGWNLEFRYNEIASDFEKFTKSLRDKKNERTASRVPETYLWAVEAEQFIGRISIRHELNQNLLKIGGHIGYEVRPTERKKGYGLLMLQMALPIARKLGIKKALLTCDDTNIPSIRIIESCGGQLENVLDLKDGSTPKRRYWITL